MITLSMGDDNVIVSTCKACHIILAFYVLYRQPRHQEHQVPLCQDEYNDVLTHFILLVIYVLRYKELFIFSKYFRTANAVILINQ